MAAKGLEAHARRRDGLSVIDLSGDIDRSAEAAMDAAYGEATAGVDTPVLLNFTNVDYINSTGIAVIVGLLARARKEHRQIIACGLSDHYKEIFSITRLSDFMSVLDDEEQAAEKAAV
jgi:anti-anti-sigma factor